MVARFSCLIAIAAFIAAPVNAQAVGAPSRATGPSTIKDLQQGRSLEDALTAPSARGLGAFRIIEGKPTLDVGLVDRPPGSAVLLRPLAVRPRLDDGETSPMTQSQIDKIRSSLSPSVPAGANGVVFDFREEMRRRREQTQIPIGGEANGGGTLQVTLKTIAERRNLDPQRILKIIEDKGADRTSCSTAAVKAIEEARVSVAALPPLVRTSTLVNEEDQRLRRWLRSPASASLVERPASIPRLKRYEAAWRTLLSECFAPAESLPAFEHLKTRIGTFDLGDSVPFCTGLLVADGKVMTARHCFVSLKGKPNFPEGTRIAFRTADGFKPAYLIAQELNQLANVKYTWDADQIVIDVDKRGIELDPLPMGNDVTPVYSPERTTQLLFIGVLPLSLELDSDKFPSGLVTNRQPSTCYVAHVDAGCMTHMCSATPGASGASLFTAESTPRWLGVHVGPETKTDSCTGVGDSIYANLAVRRTSQELTKYFR